MGDTEEDAGVEVSPPELRFLQKWHEKNPSLPHMRTVNRENVVFHAHLRQRPMATWSRLMFGSDTVPRNDNHVFSVKQLKVFSSADLTSQFVNDGYKCLGQAGKFMVFLRRRTMIRAGKYSTPQALNACFRVLRAFNSRYPTGFMAPNQVFSGEFQRPISDKLRQYRLANHSNKFPGIALNLEMNDSNCTPAVFTGRSKKNAKQNPSTFIAAGIRTADEAVECMRRIDAIAGAHTVE